MRLYGNDVTLLPDEVVKSFSETRISQEGDTKWRSEAACLAFTTAEWWSSTSVKQVGVIHPLHFSSFQASPLLSSITSDGPEEPSSRWIELMVPANRSASLQKAWLHCTLICSLF